MLGEGLLLGVVLIIIFFGRYAMPYYRNYGIIPWHIPRLKASEKAFLEKYFAFYKKLPDRSRKIFEKRVATFMHSKTFVPRNMVAVAWEMKVLISASAIQITFGFPQVHLSFFRYILVFPDKYYNKDTSQYHRGEVNPRTRSIVLGWKYFVEGYIKPDGRNLGLHEMAHALRLENRIMNHEYNFLEPEILAEWELHADNTIREIKEGRETFFREYGATDREEFFAVAVENFFERPDEFHDKHPETYNTLCRLLRQNPRLLSENQ